MKQILSFFLIVLSASGCSLYTVNSEETTEDFYPSKSSASQILYLERVDQAHKVIGYVTVNTERTKTLEEVVDQLKREAAILGGDAITDVQTDATGFWKKLPGQRLIGNAYIRINFKAAVAAFDQTGPVPPKQDAPLPFTGPISQEPIEENLK